MLFAVLLFGLSETVSNQASSDGSDEGVLRYDTGCLTEFVHFEIVQFSPPQPSTLNVGMFPPLL